MPECDSDRTTDKHQHVITVCEHFSMLLILFSTLNKIANIVPYSWKKHTYAQEDQIYRACKKRALGFMDHHYELLLPNISAASTLANFTVLMDKMMHTVYSLSDYYSCLMSLLLFAAAVFWYCESWKHCLPPRLPGLHRLFHVWCQGGVKGPVT